ncbi:related to NOP6 - protein with possible role in rRNA processing [Ustilago trichophora]|uniref:Related to NOP6 - protein with possible role in rRNA processing n=1 Tax=Ustilago trichophora TaxID=86804 RepID=A0A5C3DTU1_9BASI|nr:related to NOP6 - protein with possible role in rRNA processing [Ustilago trichophora]
MAEAKLTKKQQKAAQFKAGKKGKAGAIEDHPATPDDVPEEKEVVAAPSKPEVSKTSTSTKATAADEEAPAKPVKEEKRSAKRKRLAAEAAAGIVSEDAPATSSKTKDTAEEAKPKKSKSSSKAKIAPAPNATKTTFGDDGEVAAEEAVAAEIPTTAAAPTTAKGSKFILFVGNMAFTTTSDNISKHFGQACGEVPSVRLLTRKADPNALANLPASKRKSIAKGKAQDPTKPQSKGCAFVEFKSSEALRKALKFHHTMLEGRKINVELTAGGGGKSENRQEKIKAKNAGLEKERQKLHGKYVAPKNEARKQARDGKDEGERPQKRSRRDEGEGETQGGSWGRNSGKERKMPRFMATGSNAVRVAPTS